jgi:hypothetical protein
MPLQSRPPAAKVLSYRCRSRREGRTAPLRATARPSVSAPGAARDRSSPEPCPPSRECFLQTSIRVRPDGPGLPEPSRRTFAASTNPPGRIGARCPPLTRRKPHCTLLAPIGFLRRSMGAGNPPNRRSSRKGQELLAFMRHLDRALEKRPGQQIHLVMDNDATHKTPDCFYPRILLQTRFERRDRGAPPHWDCVRSPLTARRHAIRRDRRTATPGFCGGVPFESMFPSSGPAGAPAEFSSGRK